MSTTENGSNIQTYHDHQTSTSALVLDPVNMKSMLELATVMSAGVATVPRHLQNNQADCLAVIMQAMQWRMNPFAVAQKTHVVSGTLGYEAQLVNAVIISLAPVTGRLEFEWFGSWEKVIGQFTIKTSEKGEYRQPGWKLADEDGLGVRVWATMRGETEPRELKLLLAQARTRNSTLWADDPKQQLAYLAIKRWSRLYCPDVILGVYSPDELTEGGFQRERDVSPAGVPQASPAAQGNDTPETVALYEGLEEIAKNEGMVGFEKAWKAMKPAERLAIGNERKDRLKVIASAEDATIVGDNASPGQGAAQ